MSPKKRSPFTSIRIIGKKAQSMLQKARANTNAKTVKKTPLPKAKNLDEVLMHISVRSVVQVGLILVAIYLAFWLLFALRQKIILLLLAGFVATLIDPGVRKLESFKIPRAVAIILHYLVAIVAILFLVITLIPDIAVQIQTIANNFSEVLIPFLNNPQINIPFIPEELNASMTEATRITLQNLSLDEFTVSLQNTGQNLQNIADITQTFVSYAGSVAGSVLNFAVSLIIVLVLAFFMQLEKERILQWIRGFFPIQYRNYIDVKIDAINTKIGQWMRGELLLMFSIFLLTFIALLILGMQDYALTLAVLAGFCELIPAVGPFIAAIPAILIAGTQKGVIWILIVAIVYYIIQWCENNLLVPLIMKRAVGLSPVAILFAMMVGISFPGTIHPVLGVMLAIPFTTILSLFLDDWRHGGGKNE